jgi:hypothetical protein
MAENRLDESVSFHTVAKESEETPSPTIDVISSSHRKRIVYDPYRTAYAKNKARRSRRNRNKRNSKTRRHI